MLDVFEFLATNASLFKCQDYLGDYQPQEETKHAVIMCRDPGRFSPWQWMFMQITRASGIKIISFHVTKKIRYSEGR